MLLISILLLVFSNQNIVHGKCRFINNSLYTVVYGYYQSPSSLYYSAAMQRAIILGPGSVFACLWYRLTSWCVSWFKTYSNWSKRVGQTWSWCMTCMHVAMQTQPFVYWSVWWLSFCSPPEFRWLEFLGHSGGEQKKFTLSIAIPKGTGLAMKDMRLIIYLYLDLYTPFCVLILNLTPKRSTYFHSIIKSDNIDPIVAMTFNQWWLFS